MLSEVGKAGKSVVINKDLRYHCDYTDELDMVLWHDKVL